MSELDKKAIKDLVMDYENILKLIKDSTDASLQLVEIKAKNQ